MAIEKIDKLQIEISQHQQSLSDQAERHQDMLEKERALQEDSEKRWVQLIDQARSEAKRIRKKHDEVLYKRNDQIASLQNNLEKLQSKFTATRATLNHKSDTIGELHKQMDKLRVQHMAAVSELAALKVNFKITTSKKAAKRSAESV